MRHPHKPRLLATLGLRLAAQGATLTDNKEPTMTTKFRGTPGQYVRINGDVISLRARAKLGRVLAQRAVWPIIPIDRWNGSEWSDTGTVLNVNAYAADAAK